jgi:glutamate synthase (NADPH/NADH) large chain/glutamate synthase (ferredoxin)
MATIIPSPLYHPDQEHDACGVGLIARVTGERRAGLRPALSLALRTFK